MLQNNHCRLQANHLVIPGNRPTPPYFWPKMEQEKFPPIKTPLNGSLPSYFDGFMQNVTIISPALPFYPNGTGPLVPTLVTFPIARLIENKYYAMQATAVWGSQIGAVVIMLVVVAITTRRSKILQPIFLLNIMSLVLALIRSSMYLAAWFNIFNNIYVQMAEDYSGVPQSTINQSCVTVVFTLLLVITIEASLVLQTEVVCKTIAPLFRYTILALSVGLVLLAIACRFALAVMNIQLILGLGQPNALGQVAKIVQATQIASIWFFCAIFVAKLGWTMWLRRRMGMKQWGPMQIICISGGCTLIIPCKPYLLLHTKPRPPSQHDFINTTPAIFGLLEFFPNHSFADAGPAALTIVSIFLPLSSVWASMAVSESQPVNFRKPRLGSHDSSDDASGTHPTMATETSRSGLMSKIGYPPEPGGGVCAYGGIGGGCVGHGGDGGRKGSEASEKTAGTSATAVEYVGNIDEESRSGGRRGSHSWGKINPFGYTKVNSRGCSSSSGLIDAVGLMGDDIEMDEGRPRTETGGVRIERMFEVKREEGTINKQGLPRDLL